MVRSYISRLRRSIADADACDPIRSATGGYSLRVSDVSFDLRDFLAALLVVPETHAEDLLEALADAHLIEADGDGGYHYLNPLWNFAHRRALIDDGPDDVRAVLSRWHAYRVSIASPGR